MSVILMRHPHRRIHLGWDDQDPARQGWYAELIQIPNDGAPEHLRNTRQVGEPDLDDLFHTTADEKAAILRLRAAWGELPVSVRCCGDRHTATGDRWFAKA